MKLIKLLTLTLIIGLSSLWGTEYTVDEKNSMVTFKIRHAVIAKVEGKFNEFSGTYDYDANSSTFRSFTGVAKMASVNTDNQHRDKHLKAKIFDVEHYPTMNLKLRKQDGSSFVADLTIKEVTKSVNFTISLVAKGKNKFILSGEINREDFGLQFSDMVEGVGLVLSDKVEINILFAGI